MSFNRFPVSSIRLRAAGFRSLSSEAFEGVEEVSVDSHPMAFIVPYFFSLSMIFLLLVFEFSTCSPLPVLSTFFLALLYLFLASSNSFEQNNFLGLFAVPLGCASWQRMKSSLSFPLSLSFLYLSLFIFSLFVSASLALSFFFKQVSFSCPPCC